MYNDIERKDQWFHYGAMSVGINWSFSGAEVLGWSDAPNISRPGAPEAVDFFTNPDRFSSTNTSFGPGDTFWIDYRAPAPPTSENGRSDSFTARVSGNDGSANYYDSVATGLSEGQYRETSCQLVDGRAPSAEASFTSVVSDTDPLEVTFTSTSRSLTGNALTLEWDLGDGTTETAESFTHTFAEPGDYTVRLSASAQGRVDTVSQVIELGKEGLSGEIFRIPNTGGANLKEGEGADIRLRVENTTDGPLTEVKVDSVAVVATDPEGVGLATVEERTGEGTRRLTGDLGTEGLESIDFADYRVEAEVAGTVRVVMAVSAVDLEGAPVAGEITWDLEITPAPLKVELTARVAGADPSPAPGTPLEFVLNENDHENLFEVEARFTNQGDTDIEGLALPATGDPVGQRSLRVDELGNPIPGVAIEPLDDPNPAFADTTLEKGEATSLIYHFEGLDEAYAELSVLASGTYEDERVTGRGAVEVKVISDLLVEFGIKPARSEPYLGGQTIRMAGVLENTSDDTVVGVTVYPTTDGNAGNGIVFPADAGGRTPDTPYGFVLQPQQKIDVQALLPTAELEVASDASATWEVRAWKHEVDEATGEVTKTPAPESQIKVLDTDGYSDSMAMRIPPAEILPDVVGECGYAYFGCGVIVGLDNLASGSFDLVRLAGNIGLDAADQYGRLIAWEGQMLGEISLMLQGDDLARQRLIDEIALDAQSVLDAGAITLGQGVTLAQAVPPALDSFIRTWDQVYRTGDLERIQFELGRMAGENPDAAFSLFVAARAGRKAIREMAGANTAIREGMERAARKQEASLAERLAAAERSGQPVAKSGAFAAGDRLTLEMIRKYWGASADDVRKLFEIADAEDVLITFRSRATEAIELVRNKIAWPKAEAMKIKSIDQIDIDYLGYRRTRKGRVELVEPPKDLDIDFSLPKDELAAKAKIESERWVARNHPGLDPDTAKDVATRLQTRIEEWPVYAGQYLNDARPTVPGRFESKIDVGFNYDPQGIDASVAKDVVDTRTIRATEIIDEGGLVRPDPTRRYFEIEMSGPGGKDFRSITGDIDFMSILNLDGTFITDQAKRLRIYEHLQKLLGMQHGESFSFIGGQRAGHLRQVSEGAETAVTIAPKQTATASYFVENRSIAPDTPNAGRRNGVRGDFILLAGATHQWRAQVGLFRQFNLASLSAQFRRYYLLPLFVRPGELYRFVENLLENQVAPGAERNANPVRPDGDGGAETFTGGTGESRSGRGRGPAAQRLRTGRGPRSRRSGHAQPRRRRHLGAHRRRRRHRRRCRPGAPRAATDDPPARGRRRRRRHRRGPRARRHRSARGDRVVPPRRRGGDRPRWSQRGERDGGCARLPRARRPARA